MVDAIEALAHGGGNPVGQPDRLWNPEASRRVEHHAGGRIDVNEVAGRDIHRTHSFARAERHAHTDPVEPEIRTGAAPDAYLGVLAHEPRLRAAHRGNIEQHARMTGQSELPWMRDPMAIEQHGVGLARRDPRLDLSGRGMHSTDEATRRFARSIAEPIDVYVVWGQDEAIRRAARLEVTSPQPDTGLLKDLYRPFLESLQFRIGVLVAELGHVNPRIRLHVADAEREQRRAEERQGRHQTNIEGG